MPEPLIAGARGAFQRDALVGTVQRVRDATGVVVQALDAAAIYGAEHLSSAATKAVRAHREDRGVARDMAAEVACYVAGTHQIKEALSLVGLPPRGDRVALALVGQGAAEALDQLLAEAGLSRDDAVLAPEPETLDRLCIPEAARSVVPEERWPLLVLERVALLDSRK